jgi:uncharacterized protein GlcG (DUF336 family)
MNNKTRTTILVFILTIGLSSCFHHRNIKTYSSASLPSHLAVHEALKNIVRSKNGDFGFHMWASVVDRDGVITVVTFSGPDRGAQFPGSRVISAQKANTANAFSLDEFAISTANLYTGSQPGGGDYGLLISNPVNPYLAYRGDSLKYGTVKDPMLGKKIGGVNVFGGGLALYDKSGKIIGAIGVSGDSSAADHNICWKLRHALKLDYVPEGGSPTKDDNIVNDIVKGVSKSGWGHPTSSAEAAAIAKNLPKSHPVRKVKKLN